MGNQPSDITKLQIFKLNSEGLSPVDISTKLRLSLRTVEIALGIKPARGHPHAEKPTTVAQKKRAAWLRIQGWNCEAIARATGLGEDDIKKNWLKWAKKYQIKLPEPAPEVPPPTHGDVITYRRVNGELVQEKSKPEPLVFDDEIYEPDSAMDEYIRILRGGYKDE